MSYGDAREWVAQRWSQWMLKSDDDDTSTTLKATTTGSWSHPGWWAHCRSPSPYCIDKNHCLCLPPLPKHMQSYQMNRSTVAYFIGNASGMDSSVELRSETRFGSVGVGWQIDGIPKKWAQGLEVVELAEAKRLKALRPDVRVLVSRQSEVGTKMWNTVSALIAGDPTNAKKFFTSCRGKPCSVNWETDASFFFNWESPALRDWWVYTYIGGALNESAIDGVYLDCACVEPKGDHLPGSFQANAQLAVDASIVLATRLGKSIQTWNPSGGTAHGGGDVAGCVKAIHSAISMGNDTRYTFQPSFRGMGAPGTVTAQEYSNTIGSFLLARGESALLEYPPTASPGDLFPNATQFPWSPLLDLDFGVPLALAVETTNGSFVRQWSKATVANCSMNANLFHDFLLKMQKEWRIVPEN